MPLVFSTMVELQKIASQKMTSLVFRYILEITFAMLLLQGFCNVKAYHRSFQSRFLSMGQAEGEESQAKDEKPGNRGYFLETN